MNKFLQEMKTALTSFQTAIKSHDEQVARAKARYQADVAAAEIRKLDENLESARVSNEETILEARDKGIEAAKKWGELDGKKVSEDDMKLLKLVELSPEEFAGMVERNKNNATMCRILEQWAEQHNKKQTEGTGRLTGQYDTLIIPTVKAKVQAYSEFAQTALALLHDMTGNGWGRGSGSQLLSDAVASFAVPDPLTAPLLEALGE